MENGKFQEILFKLFSFAAQEATIQMKSNLQEFLKS